MPARQQPNTDAVERLLARAQYPAAIETLDKLIARKPLDARLIALRERLLSAVVADAGGADLAARAGGSGNALALEALGRLHERAGDQTNALDAYRQALSRRSVNPPLCVHLGNLARESGDTSSALGWYRRAISQDPRFVPALNNLAALLLDLDQIKDAVPVLDQAFHLAPDAPQVLCNVGRLERAIDRTDQARICYQKALDMVPDYFDAVIALADIEENLGNLEDARRWLEHAEVLAPKHAQVALIAARVARREKRFEDGIRLLEAALCEPVAPMLAADIHFLLGHLNDATDTDSAFEHFFRANQIKLSMIPPDVQDIYLDVIATRRAEFQKTRARLATLQKRQAERTPYFLVGFPRSGTTLLEQLLDSHPRIQALPERPAADAMRRRLEALAAGKREMDVLDSPDTLRELEAAYYREVFRHHAVRADRLLVDKMPLNLANADLIVRVFPDTRFVLALRHPHDVVLSCFMQNFQLNLAMRSFLTLEGAAEVYVAVMGFWCEIVEHLQPRVHTICYEDLVDDFESEARRLLDFLGVGWDDAVFAHVEHARTRSISTPSYHQVTQPIYRTARYRWERYAKYLDPVAERLRPFVERFGYAGRTDR